MTAQPNAQVRFRRAIERRALWLAEDAARELPNLPLEDALELVHLYAERGSPKYEKAAMRWLERYITEGSPRLQHFAQVVLDLARLEPEERNGDRTRRPRACHRGLIQCSRSAFSRVLTNAGCLVTAAARR